MAAAVSLTQHPRFPRLWVTAASALLCSLVNSPGALSVRDHILVGLRGFAFELRSSLARFLHFS